MREKTRVIVFFRVVGTTKNVFFFEVPLSSAFFQKETDQNIKHKRHDTIITLVYKYTITFLCPFAKSILYYDDDDDARFIRRGEYKK